MIFMCHSPLFVLCDVYNGIFDVPTVTDVGNKIIFPIYNYHYSSETLRQDQSWTMVFFVHKETSTYKLFCIACQFFLDLFFFLLYM